MAKAPKVTQAAEKPPIEDEEEGGEIVSIDSILEDMTPEQMAGMELHLDDRTVRPIGPNVACNGFFKKAPGAQLIGRVVEVSSRQSSFNAANEDVILFVQGVADFPIDVVKPGTTRVTQKKGRFYGTFGFQLDAGTMALGSTGKGSRLHLQVKEIVDLSGGRTRWTYDFVRVA